MFTCMLHKSHLTHKHRIRLFAKLMQLGVIMITIMKIRIITANILLNHLVPVIILSTSYIFSKSSSYIFSANIITL